MTTQIDDIIIFLRVIKEFKKERGIQKKDLFHLIKKDISLPQWEFDYQKVFELALKLKLIKEKASRVLLTDFGKDIIDMHTHKIDLNDIQKNYIVTECFFNNDNFEMIFKFLKKFIYEPNLKAFVINEKDILYEPTDYFSFLTELNVIKKINYFWQINDEYFDYVEILKNTLNIKNKKLIPSREYEKIQKEQKEVGDKAEECSMRYERNLLKKKGWDQQSHDVDQISKKYDNKGYDIESFFTRKKTCDKFIEVKGRKYREFSFFISSNEVEIAKNKGNNYVIHFWNNLVSDDCPDEPTIIIRNPYEKLLKHNCKNCVKFFINLKE